MRRARLRGLGRLSAVRPLPINTPLAKAATENIAIIIQTVSAGSQTNPATLAYMTLSVPSNVRKEKRSLATPPLGSDSG
jgi:hypothetical protein